MKLSVTPAVTPSFTGAQKYKAIRNIPNIPCACCGHKVISQASMNDAFKKLTRPLSMIIEKGFLDSWKRSPIVMDKLTKWAKEEPKSNIDTMIEEHPERYHELYDAVKSCVKNPEGDIERDATSLFKDLFVRARSLMRGSSVVIKNLMKFKDSLSGEKLDTFEQLEIYAKRYPRKTLNEIVNTKEVYKFHLLKNSLQSGDFAERVDFRFSNIEDILKKSKEFTPDEIENLRNAAMNIYTIERDTESRCVRAMKLYQDALDEKNLGKLRFKIFDELKKVPTTSTTKDSFFEYAHESNLSDSKIVDSLLRSSMSSFEHIVPHSKGGENRVDNGIVLCADCNEKRGNRHYDEFLLYHPAMPYNVEKQIAYVSDLISKGKLNGTFRFWPMRVSKTLSEYTGGKIKPDISKYCKKEQKKSISRKVENTKNYKKLKSEQVQKLREKEALKARLRELQKSLDEVDQGLISTRRIKDYEDDLSLEISDYMKKNSGNKEG